MSAVTNRKDGFTASAYSGDNAVLLSFNLTEDKIDDLAGFAIHCVAPPDPKYKTNKYYLYNRLRFAKDIKPSEDASKEKWAPSIKAPFQSFHWTHYPSVGEGNYTYTVYPCYFKDGSLRQGDGLSLDVSLEYKTFNELEVGFTRGYISSQAYYDRYKREGIRPGKKSIDFDTSTYMEKYVWLGTHARKIVFEFLRECVEDESQHGRVRVRPRRT